jgi:hypothetical protein
VVGGRGLEPVQHGHPVAEDQRPQPDGVALRGDERDPAKPSLGDAERREQLEDWP